MASRKMMKKHKARLYRQARVRSKVRGTDDRPRLCVYRSNRHLYVQVISDESGRTLAAASTLKEQAPTRNLAGAAGLGSQVAELCKKAGIENIVMDRNGLRYHGRIRALADALREAGLKL